MSKKLIAVASAAALALAGLVGVAPATAALTSVNLYPFSDSTAVNSNTALAPTEVRVPWNNALAQAVSSATSRTSTNTAVKVTSAVAAGDTLTITAEGTVKILDALTNSSTNKYNSASGTASFVYTNSTSGSVSKDVFVYTTSTTTNKLTVTNGSSTGVYYIKGLVGPAYNVSAKFPTVVGVGGTASVDATVTDVFGNKHTSTTASDFASPHPSSMVITTLGAANPVGGGTFTWNVTRSVWEGKVTGTVDAGSVAINLALDTEGGTQTAKGLPAPKTGAFASITNADLTGQVASLTAQVAALQAQMANMRTKARSVTKKKYNTLARKWNAANPGARVALKK